MAFSRNVWNQLKNLTADELIAALERDGWQRDTGRGAIFAYIKSGSPNMKKNLIILVAALSFIGCSSENSEESFRDEDGNRIEIGNPYTPGSGHHAGYEWAERTAGSCTGNSESFNEGCEEYYRQLSLSGR